MKELGQPWASNNYVICRSATETETNGSYCLGRLGIVEAGYAQGQLHSTRVAVDSM